MGTEEKSSKSWQNLHRAHTSPLGLRATTIREAENMHVCVHDVAFSANPIAAKYHLLDTMNRGHNRTRCGSSEVWSLNPHSVVAASRITRTVHRKGVEIVSTTKDVPFSRLCKSCLHTINGSIVCMAGTATRSPAGRWYFKPRLKGEADAAPIVTRPIPPVPAASKINRPAPVHTSHPAPPRRPTPTPGISATSRGVPPSVRAEPRRTGSNPPPTGTKPPPPPNPPPATRTTIGDLLRRRR